MTNQQTKPSLLLLAKNGESQEEEGVLGSRKRVGMVGKECRSAPQIGSQVGDKGRVLEEVR